MRTLNSSLFLYLLLYISFSYSEQLYVRADVANIRNKPSGKHIARLDINTPVQKEKEQGEWIYIIGPNNVTGWAHKSLFGDHILTDKEIRDSINTSTENKIPWGQRLIKVSPKEIANWKLLLQLHKDAGDSSGTRRVKHVIELLNMTYLAECDCDQMKVKVAIDTKGGAVPLIYYMSNSDDSKERERINDSLYTIVNDVNSILDNFEWYDMKGMKVNTFDKNRKIINRSLWKKCDTNTYDGNVVDCPCDVIFISLGNCGSKGIYLTNQMDLIPEGDPSEMVIDTVKIGKALTESSESCFLFEPTKGKQEIHIRPFQNIGLMEISMNILCYLYDSKGDHWIYGILDKSGKKVYPEEVALRGINFPFFTFKGSNFIYKITSYTNYGGAGSTAGTNYEDLLIIDKAGKMTIQRILEINWGS